MTLPHVADVIQGTIDTIDDITKRIIEEVDEQGAMCPNTTTTTTTTLPTPDDDDVLDPLLVAPQPPLATTTPCTRHQLATRPYLLPRRAGVALWYPRSPALSLPRVVPAPRCPSPALPLPCPAVLAPS